MNELYIIKILAAILGGVVGLSLVLHNKPITRYRVVTESLATAIFSGAVVDKYFSDESVLVCCFLGVFVGFGNGYVLDMLKAIAPRLAKFGFKAWFARAFGFELPPDVVDDFRQPETLEKWQPENVLDETRDKDAVAWLDEPSVMPPPENVHGYRRRDKL